MIKTMSEAENFIYKSYLKAINHIEEANDSKVKKPELTRKLFTLLNSPDQGQKFILVTGSKGKGSTARFISSLLSHHGLKVGLFTSPHLVHFNERIRIDGKAISNDDFIRLSNLIFDPVEKVESKICDNEYQGPIGITLAIATLYFKEHNTDINVIECGRGGLYDDTNILDNEWAAITPIMNEHISQLGPTLEHIVYHKLGIIKSGTKKVYISKQDSSFSIIKKQLKNKYNCKVSYYGLEFGATDITIDEHGTAFLIYTPKNHYQKLSLPLLGTFQAINAATAVKVCEDIIGSSIKLSILRKCFHTLQWPGRCEIIDANPLVILDGAINEVTAQYTREVLSQFKGKKIVSLIGVPSNKDFKGVIKVASKFSTRIILTKPDITHLPFDDDAFLFAQSIVKDCQQTEVLTEAISLANQTDNVDIIVIIGTQTLIANAKRLWGQSLMDIGL